jgi:hypothetical protein
MSDNFSQMNPLDGVYSEFKKILNTLVIKYSYLAETYETFEIKKEADMYVACKDGTDTFFSYRNYSADELYAAGITDASKIALYTKDDGYLLIPSTYRDTLLQNRRNSIIANYVERNDYYRQLNGLPPINTPKNKFYYIPEEYAVRYGIDKSILSVILWVLRLYIPLSVMGKKVAMAQNCTQYHQCSDQLFLHIHSVYGWRRRSTAGTVADDNTDSTMASYIWINDNSRV